MAYSISIQINTDSDDLALEKISEAIKELSSMRARLVANKNPHRGVSWCRNNQKWRARIWNGSRMISIGYFDSQEGAKSAIERAKNG
jgi:uncharacterized protein HemX